MTEEVRENVRVLAELFTAAAALAEHMGDAARVDFTTRVGTACLYFVEPQRVCRVCRETVERS